MFMRKLSFVSWISIMIFTGAHFRSRGKGVEELTVDWVIIAQLIACVVAGLIGFLILTKSKNWKASSTAMTLFVAVALFSALFNPYPTKVIGYWVLLAGTAVLTMAMVQQSKTVKELQQIEFTWFATIVGLVVYNAIFSYLFLSGDAENAPQRLGMGATHANELSFLAALGFWLSFRDTAGAKRVILWIVRLCCLVIIVLARTRMSMFCLLIGGVLHLWFFIGKDMKSLYLRVASVAIISAVVLAFVLTLMLEIPAISEAFEMINRGQDAGEITSFTGRTLIWSNAVDIIVEDVQSFIFGHGYCMSRYVLNAGFTATFWFADHAHNGILETLVSMGFIGFLALLGVILCGFRWHMNFRKNAAVFGFSFAVKAASVIAMTVVYSITEANLATKLGPDLMIFYFYVLAIDQKNVIENQSIQTHSSHQFPPGEMRTLAGGAGGKLAVPENS